MKSPLSFRDNVPGAVASGQVCRIARPTNSASSASPTTTVDEREPSLASALVDVWRGFTGRAGWVMVVDREIGTWPDDAIVGLAHSAIARQDMRDRRRARGYSEDRRERGDHDWSSIWRGHPPRDPLGRAANQIRGRHAQKRNDRERITDEQQADAAGD